MINTTARNDNNLDVLPPLARALASQLRQMMPSVADLAASRDSEGAMGLGPETAVPAMWLHLLLMECELLASRLWVAEAGPKIAAFNALAAPPIKTPEREATVELNTTLVSVKVYDDPGATVLGAGSGTNTTLRSGAIANVELVNSRLEHPVDQLPDQTVSIVCDHRANLPSPQTVSGVGEHGASHATPTSLSSHLTVTDPELGRGETL
ncbi:hypothetical protein ACFSGX_11285 [Sphingomonas arantia]|uniref:Baseplate assembly protein n=1 Tax=Sphingomonas arantia TaxID=1460676 RepID=A0ABW4U0V0_9SPHN